MAHDANWPGCLARPVDAAAAAAADEARRRSMWDPVAADGLLRLSGSGRVRRDWLDDTLMSDSK